MSVNNEHVRDTVRKGYAEIAISGGSCCGPSKSCCGASDAAGVAKAVGYSDAELATLPEGANMGLSCGNPAAIATLRPGEIVLDLGAGGGFDVFLVAQKVGPVWGFHPHTQELANMWVPTAQPGLWFTGGSFAQCRMYSKFLALQIKAVEEGLAPLAT